MESFSLFLGEHKAGFQRYKLPLHAPHEALATGVHETHKITFPNFIKKTHNKFRELKFHRRRL
jgi:hypothetical protein